MDTVLQELYDNSLEVIKKVMKENQSLRQQLAEQTLSNWTKLSDVQWMNIVNHDRAWESYSKDEAVHEAVKMSEAKCKENNSGQSVEVLLEALRKLAKYPSSPKDEMSAWTMRNLASEALSSYKPTEG